jgi:hypothetical protein
MIIQRLEDAINDHEFRTGIRPTSIVVTPSVHAELVVSFNASDPRREVRPQEARSVRRVTEFHGIRVGILGEDTILIA